MPARPTPVPLRLGLCCLFVDEPEIRYRTTTARNLSKLPRDEARQKLLDLADANSEALLKSIQACRRLGIRAFRVSSNLLPLATHPDHAYAVDSLRLETLERFQKAGKLAARHKVRLSFHPDQFVLLGSPSENITTASLRDLAVHGDLADLLGVDAINLHGGGSYGDKILALERVARTLERLPATVRPRLTLENDDRTYTVADLLPLCMKEGIPITYDVHHHRCNPDGLTVAEATLHAEATWAGREPLFHVSSPKEGWDHPQPRPHADYVDPADFPAEWLQRTKPLTVDVEAKAKERAVLALGQQLAL